MFVTSLILAFRAERRARIDRGDRDLESGPCFRRIRHDLGTCDLTPLWGENAPRARLITDPRQSRPVFVSSKGRTEPTTGAVAEKRRSAEGRGEAERKEAREPRTTARLRLLEGEDSHENRAENRIHEVLGSFLSQKSRKLPSNGPKAALMLYTSLYPWQSHG